MKAVLILVLAGVLLVPSAMAAEIQIQLEKHPAGHVFTVAENRRALQELGITMQAKEFVCATTAVWSVDTTIDYQGEWAGVSMNPKAAEFTIQGGEPGVQPKSYSPKEPLKIDVYWGDNRPKTNAQITYTISVSPEQIKLKEGGPCYLDPQKKGDKTEVTFRGEDIVEPGGGGNATNSLCAADPSLCEASGAGEATQGGNAPSPGLFLILSALAGVFVLRRRRSA